MLSRIQIKIQQMYLALGGLANTDLSSLKPHEECTERTYSFFLDFSQGKPEAELANSATLLITNIACIKDHLREWCKSNGVVFNGENLINSNPDVAIVHDLWNVDKHGALDRPPRSGHIPKVLNLRQGLTLTTGAREGSFVSVAVTSGGVETQGDGNVGLVISGDVVDENGHRLGDFGQICERAVDAWEQALVRAGVTLPSE